LKGEFHMGSRRAKELSEELRHLMAEHIEILKKQAFVALTEEELRQQEERLKRIREVSADFLAELKGSNR
jgi:hypothetical protein